MAKLISSIKNEKVDRVNRVEIMCDFFADPLLHIKPKVRGRRERASREREMKGSSSTDEKSN